MADEPKVTTKDENTEEGGIVTVVRKDAQVTKDVDVQARLAQSRAEDEEETRKAGEKAEGAAADKQDPKPDGKPDKQAAEGSGKPAKDAKAGDADDDDEELDFNSLTPKQQKAVAKLYKERRQGRRAMRELGDEMADLRHEIAGIKKGGAPAAAAEQRRPALIAKPVKPKAEDFANPEDLTKAEETYDEQKYQYRRQQEALERRAAEQKEQDDLVVAEFNKQAKAFAKEHKDYEDVMESSAPLTGIMFGHVLEHGPELAYWFAKHADRTEEISEMNESGQDRACNRIRVKLEDAAEERKKAAEAADGKGDDKGKGKEGGKAKVKPDEDEPPATVQGRGAPAAGVDRSKMTFKDREKELHKRNPSAFNYNP